MKYGEIQTRKRFIFFALVFILLLILGYMVFQLLKPNTMMPDDWIPVNLALEVALSEDEAVINADITVIHDPPSTDLPLPNSGPVLLNINTADAFALEILPGIGPVKAKAIVEYREKNGSFNSLEALLEVNGIGPATYENIKEHITID